VHEFNGLSPHAPRGLGSNLDLKADESKGTLGAQQSQQQPFRLLSYPALRTYTQPCLTVTRSSTPLISDLTAFRARSLLPYGHLVPSRLA
jgi:hypothetical protein